MSLPKSTLSWLLVFLPCLLVAQTRQPNIVFIMADQLAAAQVGCYGSGINSTPTLDSLAAAGMRFDRSYASIPICAPNRATILTGRSPLVHGVTINNMVLRPDNPTIPQALRQSGYRTGGFGKFHHTPMMLPHPASLDYLGYDTAVITEDTRFGAWLDWIEREYPSYYDEALSTVWSMPHLATYGPDRRDLRPALREAYAEHMAPRRQQSPFFLRYTSPLPKELQQTVFITNETIRFIDEQVARQPDAPFYAYVSYVNPHDPYDPPPPYDTLFKPEDMPDPIPLPSDTFDIRALEQSRDFWGGAFRKISKDTEELKKLRAYFHGSLRLVDDQIRRLVYHLHQRGLMDNTIIVFTTDHGEMLGDHALITKGVKHYDAGIRVPLIVSGSGIRRGVSDRLTCSLDFFPTFVEWSGSPSRIPLEGKSFAGTCRSTEAADGWEAITIEAPYDGPGLGVRSIITADNWRFTLFDEPGKGQLFDLDADPRELDNLYNRTEYLPKRLELHHQLTRAFMQSGYIPQYRNLPRVDGRAQRIDGLGLIPIEE